MTSSKDCTRLAGSVRSKKSLTQPCFSPTPLSPQEKYCTWMAALTRANGDGSGARRKILMSTYQKTNAAAGSSQEGITVRYTAKTHTSGGRRGGVSHSDDGRLDVNFGSRSSWNWYQSGAIVCRWLVCLFH